MDLKRGLDVPRWRNGNGTRSGEPLWLDKPGSAVGGIESEEKDNDVESMEIVVGDVSCDQEWRAFMAGQTWKQPLRMVVFAFVFTLCLSLCLLCRSIPIGELALPFAFAFTLWRRDWRTLKGAWSGCGGGACICATT